MKHIFILAILIQQINVFAQTNLLWSDDLLKYEIFGNSRIYPKIETNTDTINVFFPSQNDLVASFTNVSYNLEGNITQVIKSFKDDTLIKTLTDYNYDSYGNLYLLYRVFVNQIDYYSDLQKFDSNGNFLWQQTILPEADTAYTPISIGLINDTTVFVSVHKDFDFPVYGDDIISAAPIPLVYSYSTSGEFNWKKEINPNEEIVLFWYKIIPVNNKAYLIGASRFNDYSLISIDPNQQMSSKNIAVSNISRSAVLTGQNIVLHSNTDVYKIDFLGNVIWSASLDISSSDIVARAITSITSDNDENVYISGYIVEDNPVINYDIITWKLNSNGNIVWSYRYECNNSKVNLGALEYHNNYLYVGGSLRNIVSSESGPDYFVLKVNALTGEYSGKYQNNSSNELELVTSIDFMPDDKIALSGLYNTQLLSDISTNKPVIQYNDSVCIYPNPAENRNMLIIEQSNYTRYTLFNLHGTKIFSGMLSEGINSLDISKLNSGLYFIQLSNEMHSRSKKLLIMD